MKDGGVMLGMAVCDDRAQATVEMAVVLPVLLVLAMISYNLMRFEAAVARFDRVAPDVVIAHGVSPGGDSGAEGDVAAIVRDKLDSALDGYGVSVEVSVQDEGFASGDTFSLAPLTRTFTCELVYEPWPSALSIAGVSLGAPAELRHVRTVVVDPWKPGVVV